MVIVFLLKFLTSKDLIAINEMIKRNEIKIKASHKKRILSDSELDDETDSATAAANANKIITIYSGHHFTKKLKNIQNDRIISNININTYKS